MDKRPERLAIFPAGGVREKKTANFRQTLAGIKKMTYICIRNGGLAQLARALAWHARGHEFESRILHQDKAAKRPGTCKPRVYRSFLFWAGRLPTELPGETRGQGLARLGAPAFVMDRVRTMGGGLRHGQLARPDGLAHMDMRMLPDDTLPRAAAHQWLMRSCCLSRHRCCGVMSR